MPALLKLKSRSKACVSGLLYWTAIWPLAAKVDDMREEGEKTPKLKPLELGRVLKMFNPACLSTLRLNSTTLTSTCTVLLRTFTTERSIRSAFSPLLASAVSRATWCAVMLSMLPLTVDEGRRTSTG